MHKKGFGLIQVIVTVVMIGSVLGIAIPAARDALIMQRGRASTGNLQLIEAAKRAFVINNPGAALTSESQLLPYLPNNKIPSAAHSGEIYLYTTDLTKLAESSVNGVANFEPWSKSYGDPGSNGFNDLGKATPALAAFTSATNTSFAPEGNMNSGSATNTNVNTTYTVSLAPGVNGSSIINNNGATTGTFTAGTTINVSATPESGYVFLNWSNGDTNSNYTFNLFNNVTLTPVFGIDGFTLTTSVNPPEAATITPSGRYSPSSVVAIALSNINTNYTFNGIILDNGISVQSQALRVLMNANRTVSANYTPINHTIYVYSRPWGVGTVSGGGSFLQGSQTTLGVTWPTNYTFTGWTDDQGNNISATPSAALTVTRDESVYANFSLPDHNLTVLVDNQLGGTPYGGGSYGPTWWGDWSWVNFGVSLNPGWIVSSWTGDYLAENGVNTGNIYLNSDKTVVANLAEGWTVNLSVNPAQGGNVFLTDTNGNSIGQSSGAFAMGTTVNFRVATNTGWVVDSWSGDFSAGANILNGHVVLDKDKNIVVNMSLPHPALNVTAYPSDAATVTGTGVYNYGDTANFTFTMGANWAFNYWHTDDWSHYGFSLSDAIAMDNNYNVTGEFYSIGGGGARPVTLTLNTDPTNAGTTWFVRPNGTTNFTSGTISLGETDTIYTTPSSTNWIFNYWNGPWYPSPSFDYATPSWDSWDTDFTLTAHYSLANVTIATAVYPAEAGTSWVNSPSQGRLVGGGNVPRNENVQLGTSGNPGWVFDYWDDGIARWASLPTAGWVQTTTYSTVTNPAYAASDATHSFVAHYSPVHTLTINIAPGSGTTNIENSSLMSSSALSLVASNNSETTYTGTFREGDIVNVFPYLSPNWHLDHWDGDAAGETNVYTTFTMNGDKTATLYLSQSIYSLTLLANPANLGTVYQSTNSNGSTVGSGSYPAGTTIYVFANTTNTFNGWNFIDTNNADNNYPYDLSTNTSLVIYTNTTLQAQFINSENLTISKSGPALAGLGAQATYDIIVANSGVKDATNVTITDTLPPGLTYATNAIHNGNGTISANSNLVTWAGVTVPAGNAVYASITANCTAIGTVTNTATVSGKTASATTQIVPGSMTFTKKGPPSLTMIKGSGGKAQGWSGANIVNNSFGIPTGTNGVDSFYTIDLYNDGLTDLHNISITDAIPAGAKITGCIWNGSIDASVISSTTTNFTQTAALLHPGQSLDSIIYFHVPPPTNTNTTVFTITNTATATCTELPATNSSVVTEIQDSPKAVLITTKTGPSSVDVYANPDTLNLITYDISLTNNGSTTIHNIGFTDAIPGDISIQSVSSSVTGWNYWGGGPSCSSSMDGNTLTGNVDFLDPGLSADFTVTAIAPFTTSTNSVTITNTAVASMDEPASSNSILTSSVVTTLNYLPYQLSISKSGPTTVNIAADESSIQFDYVVSLTNSSLYDANFPQFTDILPQQLKLVALNWWEEPDGYPVRDLNPDGSFTISMTDILPANDAMSYAYTVQLNNNSNFWGKSIPITNTVIDNEGATSSCVTTLVYESPVSITKTADTGYLDTDYPQSFSYTISAQNITTTALGFLTVTDQLPPNIDVTAISLSDNGTVSVNGGIMTASWPTDSLMPAGYSQDKDVNGDWVWTYHYTPWFRTHTITIHANNIVGTANDTAVVNIATATLNANPDWAASATNTIYYGGGRGPQTSIGITKTADKQFISTSGGDVVNYTVTLQNMGTNPAAMPKIRDVFPTNMTITSITTAGRIVSGLNEVDVSVPNLAPYTTGGWLRDSNGNWVFSNPSTLVLSVVAQGMSGRTNGEIATNTAIATCGNDTQSPKTTNFPVVYVTPDPYPGPITPTDGSGNPVVAVGYGNTIFWSAIVYNDSDVDATNVEVDGGNGQVQIIPRIFAHSSTGRMYFSSVAPNYDTVVSYTITVGTHSSTGSVSVWGGGGQPGPLIDLRYAKSQTGSAQKHGFSGRYNVGKTPDVALKIYRTQTTINTGSGIYSYQSSAMGVQHTDIYQLGDTEHWDELSADASDTSDNYSYNMRTTQVYQNMGADGYKINTTTNGNSDGTYLYNDKYSWSESGTVTLWGNGTYTTNNSTNVTTIHAYHYNNFSGGYFNWGSGTSTSNVTTNGTGTAQDPITGMTTETETTTPPYSFSTNITGSGDGGMWSGTYFTGRHSSAYNGFWNQNRTAQWMLSSLIPTSEIIGQARTKMRGMTPYIANTSGGSTLTGGISVSNDGGTAYSNDSWADLWVWVPPMKAGDGHSLSVTKTTTTTFSDLNVDPTTWKISHSGPSGAVRQLPPVVEVLHTFTQPAGVWSGGYQFVGSISVEADGNSVGTDPGSIFTTSETKTITITTKWQ